MRSLVTIIVLTSFLSCGIYSFTGADTAGAETFSVKYFKPQSPLATPTLGQEFTEALKDLILQQSTLDLVEERGELRYSGSITGYTISPVAIQADETASLNRLEIQIKVEYENTIDDSKSFERVFSKFTDYDRDQDISIVEEVVVAEIVEQLTQEILNASLGNW